MSCDVNVISCHTLPEKSPVATCVQLPYHDRTTFRLFQLKLLDVLAGLDWRGRAADTSEGSENSNGRAEIIGESFRYHRDFWDLGQLAQGQQTSRPKAVTSRVADFVGERL